MTSLYPKKKVFIMRIAIAQINPIVGDIDANVAQIRASALKAIKYGAEILVTPELALTGYGLDDLLFREHFFDTVHRGLDELLDIDGITMVIGYPSYDQESREHMSSAIVLRDGNILARYSKMLLQNDGMFDEVRYFSPGFAPTVFEYQGVNIGLMMDSDWEDDEPFLQNVDDEAALILVLGGQLFEHARPETRAHRIRHITQSHPVPVIYANAACAQDEWIWEGASFALNKHGELTALAPKFVEHLLLVDLDEHGNPQPSTIAKQPSDFIEETYQALVFSIKEYFGKNGFQSAILGLSGGIDSALVLALTVDALGAKRVKTVMMPSEFTSQMSLDDAADMAQRLNVSYEILPIRPMQAAFETTLAPLFAGRDSDTTEENLQSRIRGTLLMAISNKTGALVLTTGNKSELATGYCTLYGDMAGGFAPIKDVPKTLVYELSRWRNTQSAIIPERIITRAPSAELRPDQTDQDSLPPYEVLDKIMEYALNHYARDTIIAKGFDANDVDRIISLIKSSEYKRKQSVCGPKISARSFGRDWRIPLTHRFND